MSEDDDDYYAELERTLAKQLNDDQARKITRLNSNTSTLFKKSVESMKPAI